MELITIGQIIKAHGLNGEVKVFFDEKQLSRLKKIETLFIRLKDGDVPHLITSLRKAKDNAYFVSFDEIVNRSDADRLIGREVLADKNMFRKKEIAEGYSFTVDFMLIDKSYGEVGIIQDILQLPANDVAQVFIDEKEILLPLNDSTVIEINKRKKQVLVQLPDGIINMYLSL